MKKAELYSPRDLLEKLRSESNGEFVYRGESAVFHGPQWPSSYRRFFRSETAVRWPGKPGQRSVGEGFYFRLNFLRGADTEDEANYQERFKAEEIKHGCKAYIRNALGYPLAEAMFQQAGWTSEGIDVTYEPAVALAFALTTWNKGEPIRKTREQPAALFRYRAPSRDWTFQDLNKIDYNSSPSFLPTREICRLFPVGSDAEFRESLSEYREAIGWSVTQFDLDSIRGRRPFGLITLPQSWATSSRVELQHAALILPDSVHPRMLSSQELNMDFGMMTADAVDPTGQRLAVSDCIGHGEFVEDLSSRRGAERFLIDLSRESLLEEIAWDIDCDILPAHDPTFDLMSDWIKPFYRDITQFGGGPVTFSLPGGTSVGSDFVQRALAMADPERGYCD